MAKDPVKIVRDVIAQLEYMTIATSDGTTPWLAPVYFIADKDLNFYFASLPSSRHVQHIMKNPQVGLSIYDSGQPLFTGCGVQIEGVCEVYSETENPFATIDGQDMSADLQEVLPGYVAFKVTPKKVYTPIGFLNNELGDTRVEVDIL